MRIAWFRATPPSIAPLIEGRDALLAELQQEMFVELNPKTAADPASYTLGSWHYERTWKYGSPQLKADGTPGQDWMGASAAHLSADGRSVLVHCLDADDPDAVVRDIKTRYERRLKEIFE